MAKAIMIQGTTSGAGKSLLTAGLCRIFRQDGYKVAPFKSQNMALNSYITRQGLEMGRAQVMQAQAAGIEPTADMNPILLKPTNDTGSQVIVNGEVLGNMSASEYFRYKKNLIPQIMGAYRRLEQQYDIIVLEGAGSPAEINLKQEDIVNMGMARMAGAPVLLAGDIDRGGVFASLAGTLMLLEPEERAMVKGHLINKFRGDRQILAPGLDMLEQLTSVPVLGVIPYLHLDLDDEDSLSGRLDKRNSCSAVDIAVIRLPRISNFTDMNPLEVLPEISVRYVTSSQQFGAPDFVILPGTKNTMEDLLWLRQNGLEAKLLQYAASGGPILGICGGYQMLGQQLCDPNAVEYGGELAGMGLLPITTVFEQEKTRTRISGAVLPVQGMLAHLSGVPFEGYEIHMGKTILQKGALPFASIQAEPGGACIADGAACQNIYGTYVHGFFDNKETAEAFAEALYRKKGLDPSALKAVRWEEHQQRQYDILADNLRQNVKIDKIYEILEKGL